MARRENAELLGIHFAIGGAQWWSSRRTSLVSQHTNQKKERLPAGWVSPSLEGENGPLGLGVVNESGGPAAVVTGGSVSWRRQRAGRLARSYPSGNSLPFTGP